MTTQPSFQWLLRTMSGFPRTAREDVEAFQAKRLRRLVLHAYQNVPYYRRLFDRAGVNPREIRSATDLTKIPITTKHDLRAQDLADLISSQCNPARLVKLETSGFSGEPLVLYRSWQEQLLLHGFLLRANRNCGLRARDHMVAVGIVKPPRHNDRKIFGNALRQLGVYRVTKISSKSEAGQIAEQLRAIKPDVVTGYPSLLTRVAEHLTEEDRAEARVRFLMAGAEALTPHHRERITAGFGAPVFDIYSSFEFHITAWECGDTGEMHISDDSAIVEVVRDGQPVPCGEEGEVVGTALHSYAMPLIRYRLGDMVVRGGDRCSCGMPYSTIRSLRGRDADYVRLPDGRTIHEFYLDETVFEDVRTWVVQYQFIQKRLDHFVVHLVPTSPPPDGKLESLRQSLRSLFGREMEVEIRLVNEIQSHPGGKHQVLRSEL